MQILSLYGQSNYDLSLQIDGGFDNIVKLCNINNIKDLNKCDVRKIVYNENPSNPSFILFPYATTSNPRFFFDPTFFDPTFFDPTFFE